MPYAITNNQTLAYIAEVTAGTTPATPTGQIVRHTGFTPKMEHGTTKSAEQTTNREVADIVLVSAAGGLDINFELSYSAQFEDWLESLLQGAWAANVLKVGTTRKTFTFQNGMSDVTQFEKWLFALCNKMNFSIGKGNIITGQAGFVSKFPTFAGTTIWTGTTAAGTNNVMDPINYIQVMQEGGAGSMSGVTEFGMELSNGIISLDQVAGIDPLDIQAGQFEAKGNFSMYFADTTYQAKFAAHTQTSLIFTLGGAASKKYSFSFAKVRLTAGEIANAGNNQAVIQKYTWEAYKDATDTTCKITRTP